MQLLLSISWQHLLCTLLKGWTNVWSNFWRELFSGKKGWKFETRLKLKRICYLSNCGKCWIRNAPSAVTKNVIIFQTKVFNDWISENCWLIWLKGTTLQEKYSLGWVYLHLFSKRRTISQSTVEFGPPKSHSNKSGYL